MSNKNLHDFKPCPCCGSRIYVRFNNELIGAQDMIIKCSKCGVELCKTIFSVEDIEDMIKTWNKRKKYSKENVLKFELTKDGKKF